MTTLAISIALLCANKQYTWAKEDCNTQMISCLLQVTKPNDSEKYKNEAILDCWIAIHQKEKKK